MRLAYLPINEWLMSAVNVGKYAIHGSMGMFAAISIVCFDV